MKLNPKAIMGIDNINYCDYNMEKWILQAGLSWVPLLLCIFCVSLRKNSLLGLCLILLAGFSVTSTFISTKWVEFHMCWYIAGTVLLLSEFNSAIRFHYYWNRSSLLAWTMDILLIISAFVLVSLHVMVNFKHIIYWKLSKGAWKFKFSFASVCSFLLLYQT